MRAETKIWAFEERCKAIQIFFDHQFSSHRWDNTKLRCYRQLMARAIKVNLSKRLPNPNKVSEYNQFEDKLGKRELLWEAFDSLEQDIYKATGAVKSIPANERNEQSYHKYWVQWFQASKRKGPQWHKVLSIRAANVHLLVPSFEELTEENIEQWTVELEKQEDQWLQFDNLEKEIRTNLGWSRNFSVEERKEGFQKWKAFTDGQQNIYSQCTNLLNGEKWALPLLQFPLRHDAFLAFRETLDFNRKWESQFALLRDKHPQVRLLQPPYQLSQIKKVMQGIRM